MEESDIKNAFARFKVTRNEEEWIKWFLTTDKFDLDSKVEIIQVITGDLDDIADDVLENWE